MERIFHSILASRVLLHIRFQASHNSWTVGLTDLQWGQVSHLSDFIGLDQISPENDPPTKVEPHFLQQGGLSEVGKELFSASGSTNCPPRRISTSNFIGSFTSR
jgi:hypothetical protein